MVLVYLKPHVAKLAVRCKSRHSVRSIARQTIRAGPEECGKMSDQNEVQLPAVSDSTKEKTNIARIRPYEESGIVYFKPRRYERCSIRNTKIKDFKNSELISASGKGGRFEGVDFRYSDMENCYFHEAHFENCNFTGVKMRRCNFRTATFNNCRFEYITIDETPIDYRQVVKQLPSWPNVAQEILQALRRNAVTLGETKEVRELTLLEVEQEREHLRRARKRQESYYDRKYGSFRDQFRVRLKSLTLWLSGIIWGHGEKLINLVASCFFFVAVLSCFSAARDVYLNPTISFLTVVDRAWQYFKVNSLEVLGVPLTTAQSQPIEVLATLYAIKIVFGGMFVVYIFRSISRR